MSPQSIPSRPNSRSTTRNFSRPSTFYKVEDESLDMNLASSRASTGHHHSASTGGFSAHRQQRYMPPPIVSSPQRPFSQVTDSGDESSVAFYSPVATVASPDIGASGSSPRISSVGLDGFDLNANSISVVSKPSSFNNDSISHCAATSTGLRSADLNAAYGVHDALIAPHSLQPNTTGTSSSPTSSTSSSPSKSRYLSKQPNWQSFAYPPKPSARSMSKSPSSGMSTNNNGSASSLQHQPQHQQKSSQHSHHPSLLDQTSRNELDNNTTYDSNQTFTLTSTDSTTTEQQSHFPSSMTSKNPEPIENKSILAPSGQKPTEVKAASSLQPVPRSSKPSKICNKCSLPISGQFVRALDSAYHIDCFTCADCGKKCSAKFFPVDSPHDGRRVPLCEYDYFRRLDLLCYACDGPLRGSYITAIGRKYHIEHFKCSVCSCVLGPEDTYYEHDENVLCHYHYSTLHAAKCEGCQSAILKQFVEIYRGGREYQWHPECYMIFKFWNVKLSPHESGSNQLTKTNNEVEEDDLFQREWAMEKRVFRIWTILCAFEEATAACISDMLQHASSGAYDLTLRATCSLVFHVEILFEALDQLLVLISPLMKRRKSKASTIASANGGSGVSANGDDDDDDYEDEEEELYSPLGREPKTLCKKLVAFMSVVSKAREKGDKQLGVTQDLLTLVTSLAHYLKVLLRYGLSSCLQYDRQFVLPHGGKEAVDSFLEVIEKYQSVPSSSEILSKLKVNAMTADHCMTCDTSVEDKCIHYKRRQWHMACFICSNCNKPLSSQLSNAKWVSSMKSVFCVDCSPPQGVSGFVYASRLSQYMVLLKIAVARLQLVLNAFDLRDQKNSSNDSKRVGQQKKSLTVEDSTSTPAPQDSSSTLNSRPSADDKARPMEVRTFSGEKGYMTTLKDIRRLRSTKLDKRVSSQDKRIRRSTILDMPSSEFAQVKDGISPAVDASKATGYFQYKPGATASLTSGSASDKDLSAQLSPSSGSSMMQQQQAKLKQAQLEAAADEKSGGLGFFKRNKKKKDQHQLKIHDEPDHSPVQRRTTDLFNNEKSLTLDDIPRIVAAEKAREQQPNAFRHRAKQALSTELPTQRSVSEGKDVMNARYISDLSAKELYFIRYVAISKIYPMVSKWLTMEELLDAIEVKKSASLWDKFGKAFGASRKPKGSVSNATGVFGQSLEVLVEKHGVDSTLGVGPSTLRIPAFVDDVIVSMRQKDMSVEGIFRKNGNIRRLKEFTEKIDKNPDEGGILAEENAIQLAALLKKFLRELPEPLMTYKLQKLWITAQKITDPEAQKKLLHLSCLLLPKIHRDVSEVLFYFLNWVASFSQIDEESGSKMDTHNLATVITPNILYLQKDAKETAGLPPAAGVSQESGDAYFLSIESINALIENQQHFALVPNDIWSLYEKCNFTEGLNSKEIISLCDQTWKTMLNGSEPESQPQDDSTTSRHDVTPNLVVDSEMPKREAIRPTFERTNSSAPPASSGG